MQIASDDEHKQRVNTVCVPLDNNKTKHQSCKALKTTPLGFLKIKNEISSLGQAYSNRYITRRKGYGEFTTRSLMYSQRIHLELKLSNKDLKLYSAVLPNCKSTMLRIKYIISSRDWEPWLVNGRYKFTQWIISAAIEKIIFSKTNKLQ